jgi:FkbH-like protein
MTGTVDERQDAQLPPSDLSSLMKAGQLAERYPEIAAALAGLSGAELYTAGRLLSRLSADEVHARHPQVPTIGIAVTGHGELSALLPALAAETARHGLLPRLFAADFGGYVRDLAEPTRPLHAAQASIVLCLLDPVMIMEELPTPWQVADVERVLDEKIRLLGQLAARFSSFSGALLVMNTLPLSRLFTAQLVDHHSRELLGAVWREANARLLRLATTRSGLVVLDLDPILADGIPAADVRLSTYTKSHLSAALLAAYAREVGHLARNLIGQTKKALVLDLDNTVWGGVLGDDGWEGIEVADSYRGEAFRAFQRTVKQLGSQGILVSVVSKNELDSVRQALRAHPAMTLREEDFVRITANWRPKPENIRLTAEALNIGLDSLVYLDDSPYECGLVRQQLPAVTTLQLNDEPALHVTTLLRDGWFDVRETTAEDRARPVRYREDQARSSFLESFDSIEDYLRGLGVEVRLQAAADADIARVSQLSLRTNQFNLTTRRLQPEDVRTLAADPAAQVLTIRSADRFGDNGLVGAVFLHRQDGAVHIDNFLLSCRVFARGIEQACLASVLRQAADGGATAVYATYRYTAKNAAVRQFYPQNGFEEDSDDGERVTFRHRLASVPPPPEHVNLIDNQGDTQGE